MATELRARTEEILRRYETRLHELALPVVTDDEMLRAFRLHTRHVIDDCVRSIDAGAVVVAADLMPRAAGLGVTCARRNVHPVQTTRAGAELFDIVGECLAGMTDGQPSADRVLSVAFRALSRSISARVEVASARYDAMILDRIQEIETENRRRLAREIHDGVGNSVSLAIRQLELYELRSAHADPMVTAARQVLAEVLDGTRRLVSDLRYQAPVECLGTALETFVRATDSGVAVDVSVHGDLTPLPGDYRDELFVVIREALRNALAHADATRIEVHVRIDAERLQAVIEDDGVGFDPQADAESAGLASMRERTTLLGGHITTSSRIGHGSRVEIRVPLPERRDVAVL